MGRPKVKYCSENSKRLIHFSTCEIYGKTVGSFLPKDSPLLEDPAYYLLKENDSTCTFGPIEKQRWSYACAKQLIERLIYAEGAENGLQFTIVRPFNWIGPRMDFIPGIDGPSEGVPRVLACFSNNLLRREPPKLVDSVLNISDNVQIFYLCELEFNLDELRKELASLGGGIFPHSVLSTQQISTLSANKPKSMFSCVEQCISNLYY